MYNLDAIISVGYRVNTSRGVEFRQWANKILKDYILIGASLKDLCKKLFAFSKLNFNKEKLLQLIQSS